MPELDRLDKQQGYNGQEKYQLSIDRTDTFSVWPVRSRPGKFGFHVQNQKCDNVISLWGLTPEQLLQIHDSIASTLGLPTAVSIDDLRNLHETLTQILSNVKTDSVPFDDSETSNMPFEEGM